MRIVSVFGAGLFSLISLGLPWGNVADAQSRMDQAGRRAPGLIHRVDDSRNSQDGLRVWGETSQVEQSYYSSDAETWVGAEVREIPCDPMPPFNLACDTCDGVCVDSCDGWGCESNCGAFCLLGGHDQPYDFAYDVLGLDDVSCFDIGGWVQFGYHSQSDGQFNSHPNRLNNSQSWIFMEKTADGQLGLDWGFRVDAMYGVDAQDTQAFGNNPGQWDFQNGYDHGIYGFAIPQLYFDVAYEDVTLRMGHFYTLLGYEAVPAPNNFFYSHSFTMYNSEAFTHTGLLMTFAYSDDIELYAGWTSGWDTGFDRFQGGSSFLGGAKLHLTDGATLAYITTIGDFGKIGDGYSHSLVLDLELTDDLNYIFQSDVLHTNQANFAPGTETSTIGVNQYLIYDVNEWLAVGGRGEWWKADGVSYYEVTGGINIKPTGNLVIRPEVRYQWSPSGNDFSAMTNKQNPAGLPVGEGAIFGVDAILTF